METSGLAGVQGAAPKAGQTADKNAAQSAGLASTDFNSFLTLLTAQLRNQDPLNPQDSTQWVAQLATFSSVEQQIKTNSLLEGIAGGLGGAGDLLQSASQWIGRDVEAAADSFAYGGEPVSLIAPQGASGIARDFVVRDPAGKEVFRTSIGSARAEFQWNGRDNNGLVAPQGVYRARVETTDSEGNVSSASLNTRSRVEEARLVDGAVQLILRNGSTAAPSGVQAVIAPIA